MICSGAWYFYAMLGFIAIIHSVYQLCFQKILIHTTYSWNIKWQKCVGISGVWVLNEISQRKISWKYKKNRGSRLEVTR